jgi:hypothetical protein
LSDAMSTPHLRSAFFELVPEQPNGNEEKSAFHR